MGQLRGLGQVARRLGAPPHLPRRQHTIPQAALPSQAQVVIAGAGMIGNSVAYHLVQRGWSDIVIIDKGGVADGTSR